MYSRKQYDEFTQDQAQEAFSAMAQEYFGDRFWKKHMIETGLITAPGLSRWFRNDKDNRPPFWAFCLVSSWLETREAAAHIRAIRDALTFAQEYDDRI